MDDIVRQALAKWPNVPHCFGWLALDARGNWRMRDERAQTLKLAGDRIGNAALLGFINRNYQQDDRGRWYFQNGPQRVYVNLEATPYIARTEPRHGFILHTGEPLAGLVNVFLTNDGLLLFETPGKVALLDDRDMAQCLDRLLIDAAPAEDDRLMAWLEEPAKNGVLTFHHAGTRIPVRRIERGAMASQFGFVPVPQP